MITFYISLNYAPFISPAESQKTSKKRDLATGRKGP